MNNHERTITVHKNIEVRPTAQELACVFWAMNCEEQADFFNALGEISGHLLPMQLQHVTDASNLKSSGRDLMYWIGKYSNTEGVEE